MHNLIREFSILKQQMQRLPFSEQEAACKSMQFTLEDFAKRFPPYAIKVYSDIFGVFRIRNSTFSDVFTFSRNRVIQ